MKLEDVIKTAFKNMPRVKSMTFSVKLDKNLNVVKNNECYKVLFSVIRRDYETKTNSYQTSNI